MFCVNLSLYQNLQAITDYFLLSFACPTYYWIRTQPMNIYWHTGVASKHIVLSMCNTFAFHWFKKSLSWMWWEKLIIVVNCLCRVFQRKLTCIGWTQPSFWNSTEDKYVLCKLIIIYYIYMRMCVCLCMCLRFKKPKWFLHTSR